MFISFCIFLFVVCVSSEKKDRIYQTAAAPRVSSTSIVFLFGRSRPRRTKMSYPRYDPASQGRAA